MTKPSIDEIKEGIEGLQDSSLDWDDQGNESETAPSNKPTHPQNEALPQLDGIQKPASSVQVGGHKPASYRPAEVKQLAPSLPEENVDPANGIAPVTSPGA